SDYEKILLINTPVFRGDYPWFSCYPSLFDALVAKKTTISLMPNRLRAKLPKDAKPHFLVGLFLCLSEITHYACY
ncbi:hypothetical protein, partial [Yersinia ruckeri]